MQVQFFASISLCNICVMKISAEVSWHKSLYTVIVVDIKNEKVETLLGLFG